MKKNTKKQEEPWMYAGKKPLIDSLAYWFVQLALAVAAIAGIKFYLQPVDEILANIFSVSFVACVLYITYRNR